MRKISILILIAISLAVFCSCSILSFDRTEIRGGTPLNKEELENIKSDIFADNDVDSSINEDSEVGSPNENDVTVYWTENGSLWHTHQDCRYLKNSTNIISGTQAEAEASGKSGLCSSCSNIDAESETTESVSEESSAVEDEIIENPCYWTPNGKTWHTDRDCHYIKNSKDVISGSVEQAKNEGKTSLCSACAKNDAESVTEETVSEESTTSDFEIIEDPYYWTPSGTTWHADRDCYHIKDSETVIVGTIEKAMDEGKTHGCSSCIGKDNENESGNESKDDETICYWISGSSIWHTFKDCKHLENSTRISSGTEEEAIAAGKSHLCSLCASREE